MKSLSTYGVTTKPTANVPTTYTTSISVSPALRTVSDSGTPHPYGWAERIARHKSERSERYKAPRRGRSESVRSALRSSALQACADLRTQKKCPMPSAWGEGKGAAPRKYHRTCLHTGVTVSRGGLT